MIVCDHCKNVTKPAVRVDIVTIKVPPPMNPKESLERPKKKKHDEPREMIRVPLDLCEDCINKLHSVLGRMSKAIQAGNEPC